MFNQPRGTRPCDLFAERAEHPVTNRRGARRREGVQRIEEEWLLEISMRGGEEEERGEERIAMKNSKATLGICSGIALFLPS